MKRTGRRMLTAALLALLAGALVFFNLPETPLRNGQETAVQAAQEENRTQPGHEPGQYLPDFTLRCLDGTDFILSEHRGQTVFLNLWATWCGPCVKELPWFDGLLRDHAGEAAVLAVHSDLMTEDVAAFLSGFDYALPFAVDITGEVTALAGGSALLPQTLVINGRGEVIYNQAGSVTRELLEDLLKQAQESMADAPGSGGRPEGSNTGEVQDGA